MQAPLSYATSDRTALFIDGKLQEREHERRLALLLKLAVGIPACFIAPFVLAAIAAEIAWRFGKPLPFWTAFIALALALVPLVLWRASRHRTDFLGDAIAEVGVSTADVYRASSYGEWEMRHTWLTWGAYAELFFWGPYILLDALEAWRGDREASMACRLRAVQVLQELSRHDGGVPIVQLQLENEPRQALAAVLRYLRRQEWVDLSQRRDRVWLLSEARDRLQAKPRSVVRRV